MFYTLLFTSKRGPLAKIWLAAHWEKKLTKAHVFECNLETTIRDIISPKMEVGLRTCGHLLIGVVRIYSRKAKYLLADCSDAMVKIKIAFRPGQTDMAEEGREAPLKAITLNEDFTTFDAHLPDSSIEVEDHFSLNQSRSDEITLKEDFGNDFLDLVDFGDKSRINHVGLLGMSFQSLTHYGDSFGDEDRGLNLLDFLMSDDADNFIQEEPQRENPETSALNYPQDADRMEVETPAPSETTLLANEAAFALEPVPITPNWERKRGKRKRRLIVDQTKKLSDKTIREQLSDFSDLVVAMDLAPPTLQLMLWKENGGVDKLLTRPCSSIVAPQITKLFSKSMKLVCEEVEVMRYGEQEGQGDMSRFSVVISDRSLSSEPEKTHNTDLTVDHMSDTWLEYSFKLMQEGSRVSGEEKDQNRSEFTHPELPSEDSMSHHLSFTEQETQSASFNTQSLLDSQVCEERRIMRRAQKLLNTLKSNHNTTFSLEALCDGGSRSQAAANFYCFLVLEKQKALQLHQRAPYEDIVATPGPMFFD